MNKKYTIKVSNNTESLYSLDNLWREYVGGDDFLNAHIVLNGNRDYISIEDSSWFTDMMDLLNDIDMYDLYLDNTDLLDSDILVKNEYINQYGLDKFNKVAAMFNDTRDPYNNEFYCKALSVLYPDSKFETFTIRGYSQSEWQSGIAKDVDTDYLQNLESFYFGKVQEIALYENDDFVVLEYATDDSIWTAEKGNNLKDYLISLVVDYMDDVENVTFEKFTGYKQVATYETF